MSLMKDMMTKHQEMIGLLSEVICDVEDNDGYITPPVYEKIKQHFKEDIPENMQKQIDTWNDLYNIGVE